MRFYFGVSRVKTRSTNTTAQGGPCLSTAVPSDNEKGGGSELEGGGGGGARARVQEVAKLTNKLCILFFGAPKTKPST